VLELKRVPYVILFNTGISFKNDDNCVVTFLFDNPTRKFLTN
jgi:hypothetical protein